MKYIQRILDSFVEKTLNTRPLVYLNGPRQTGKSTLARNLQISRKTNFISFDSPLILSAAKSNPVSFVQSLPGDVLNIIDEVQMADEIQIKIYHAYPVM
jgi:predicted AAA+ superfamily ATPase